MDTSSNRNVIRSLGSRQANEPTSLTLSRGSNASTPNATCGNGGFISLAIYAIFCPTRKRHSNALSLN